MCVCVCVRLEDQMKVLTFCFLFCDLTCDITKYANNYSDESLMISVLVKKIFFMNNLKKKLLTVNNISTVIFIVIYPLSAFLLIPLKKHSGAFVITVFFTNIFI